MILVCCVLHCAATCVQFALQIHQKWGKSGECPLPRALSRHLGDTAVPGADRLCAWIAWLSCHANAKASSHWRVWISSLPTTSDVALPRTVSLQQARATCPVAQRVRSEQQAHETRWRQVQQNAPHIWRRLQAMLPGEEEPHSYCIGVSFASGGRGLSSRTHITQHEARAIGSRLLCALASSCRSPRCCSECVQKAHQVCLWMQKRTRLPVLAMKRASWHPP